MRDIKEVLSELSANNDSHWTADGLPRLETMKFLTANPSITREQINAEAPTFNRAQLLAAPPLPQAPAVPLAPTGTDSLDSAAGSDTSTPQLGGVQLNMSLDEAIAQGEAEVNAAKVALHKAKIGLDALQGAVDALIHERDSGKKVAENNTGAYLESQKRLLADRAARLNAIRDSGLNLGRLVQGLKSPIDHAFKGRRRA